MHHQLFTKLKFFKNKYADPDVFIIEFNSKHCVYKSLMNIFYWEIQKVHIYNTYMYYGRGDDTEIKKKEYLASVQGKQGNV